jgi:hypothetical protein
MHSERDFGYDDEEFQAAERDDVDAAVAPLPDPVEHPF